MLKKRKKMIIVYLNSKIQRKCLQNERDQQNLPSRLANNFQFSRITNFNLIINKTKVKWTFQLRNLRKDAKLSPDLLVIKKIHHRACKQ